ncbi:MAG: autotransporter outer membrane beta-barrel domain-containing protein [Proteobacteria bacterium]|nr:autotransporter outer membrane beta-barrel domain-containing protein [Pseudomonadota bacterium]
MRCQLTRKTHRFPSPTVAPISRAIRAALTVSATLLTLSMPVASCAAAAGSHVVHGNTQARHGQSARPVTDAGFAPAVDLTVVADDALPSSVHSSFGLAGGDVGRSGDSAVIVSAGSNNHGIDDPANAGVHDMTVVNGGDVLAVSDSPAAAQSSGNIYVYGTYYAVGIHAANRFLSKVDTSGIVDVHATAAHATAYGVVDLSVHQAYVHNESSGHIAATADALAGNGVAVGAYVEGGIAAGLFPVGAELRNDGYLGATATAVGGTASATGAHLNSRGAGSTFYNTGDVAAHATSTTGLATATGVLAVGYHAADATNQGTISATASGAQAVAAGMDTVSFLQATTRNAGTITVEADGTLAPYGQFEAMAVGVYNAAALHDSSIDNSGSISVTASATTDITGTSGFLVAKAIGARAVNASGGGQALISNSGDISASAVTSQGYASAWGAVVQSGAYGVGDAEIDNSGSIASSAISAVGGSVTFGAYVHSGDTAAIVNQGDISATSQGGRGYANVSSATAYATGAKVYGFGTGAGGSSVSNHGTIQAHAAIVGGYMAEATALDIYGSRSTIDNAAGASIYATANTELFGLAHAVGIKAGGKYGVNVVNDGHIVVYSHAHAYDNGVYGYTGASGAVGVEAKANYKGNISVVNHGDISAHAVTEHGVTFFDAGAGATGIHAYARYNGVVENSGTISAIASSDLGDAAAYGVSDRGKYYTHIVNDAGGSIVASATTGSLLSDTYGGRAIAMGAKAYGATRAVIDNAGSIVAQAVANADGGANASPGLARAWGATIGAYSTVESGSVINHGDIQASATAAYASATSFGTYVRDVSNNPTAVVVASTANDGSIASAASADHGDAFAVGSYLKGLRQLYYVDCSSGTCHYPGTLTPNGGTASLDNAGAISAVATAHGGTGDAYGAVVLGAFGSAITNSGHIGASVDADTAHAVGASINSLYGVATVLNSGSIGAMASGATASASGVFVAGAYGNANTSYVAATVDNQGHIWAKATGTTTATAIGIEATGWKNEGIRIDNSGTIAAGAYGTGATATAVSMLSHGDNLLTNSGRIGAYGDGARIAIASSDGATATLVNTGTITGAIVTGGGNDTLNNQAGGIWNAIGASSNFGAGDDTIDNAGTIVLHNTSLSLGSFGAQGNVFANSGTIMVSGANVIDMGAGNPNPFANTGSVDFRNGAPTDALTVLGDWTGSGRIALDVDIAHNASDTLHVAGSVAAGSVTAVDVNLLTLPTTAWSSIPIVQVDGNSTPGAFVIGNVHFDTSKSFLTLQASVIDSGTAHPDVFSLGVAVTGLTDTGALAAAFAPGVQRLMGSEVGTWRERMGVLDPQPQGHVGVWVRAFSDDGRVNPTHVANNFGQGGNVAFDQGDSGQELGVDIAIADGVSAGLVLGKAQASQRLVGSGQTGRNRITGDTYGAYATWVGANGAYLDVSYRQMRFDARLDSVVGESRASGKAEAFNGELGWTWALGDGYKLVPQLQYTRTTVSHVDTLTGVLAGFTPNGGASSRGRAGVLLSKDIAAGGTTWTPYASASAVHEFDGSNGFTINNVFSGSTSTQGTSTLLEGGLAMRSGKLSVFGGVNWQNGGALSSVFGGQLGLRYSW